MNDRNRTALSLANPASSTSLSRFSPTAARAALEPAHDDVAMALLTSCFTLVKPVGMSPQDAMSWLTVASDEIRNVPEDILADACAHARRTCTHHGQIVPTILKEAEPRIAQRQTLAAPIPEPVVPQLTCDPWMPTRAEIEAIKAQAAKGLRA